MSDKHLIDIIKNLSSEEIWTMINDSHNKNNLKPFHISNINVSLDLNIEKKMITIYSNLFSENHVRSLQSRLDQKIIDKNGNESKIIDILIANNKFKYLSPLQLNSYIDYSDSNYVIEILKHDELINNINDVNVQSIDLNDTFQKFQNIKLFRNFIARTIKKMEINQINLLNLSNKYNAKIIRENNLFDLLCLESKIQFHPEELLLCNYSQLSNFSIPRKGGSMDIAVGIVLFKFFNDDLTDDAKTYVIDHLNYNTSVNKKYNEIYFAKCIMTADERLHHFPFDTIESHFFEFFDKLDIFDYMTYNSFTKECKMFGITPLDVKSIISRKIKHSKNDDLIKNMLIKITSPILFNSCMGSEYRNALKEILNKL